jgi:DHA3 family tetracycline resistance protein-like MFS transporter
VNRLPADRLWYVSEAVGQFSARLAYTIAAVYFVTEVGMSPLQLVLTGTTYELAYFLLEVPTAVLADTYSRRASVVLGTVLTGVAFVLIALAPTVPLILAATAFMGVGQTFVSGAFDAWLADEVGLENVGRVYQHGAQLRRAGALLGIGVSVALATIELRLPIVMGGVTVIALGGFLAFAMPETAFARRAGARRAAMWAGAGDGIRHVRGRPLLLLVLGITLFAGAHQEALDRLWEAHFLIDVGLPGLGGLDPVVWFGIFNAGSLLLALAVARPLARRLEDVSQETVARVLLVLDIVLAVGTLAFALAGGIVLALAAFWLVWVVRSLSQPTFATWVNRNIDDSSVRATVISITNQSHAVGEWAGGPALGVLGNAYSVRVALAASAACLAPAVALYARAVRHHGREPELAAASAAPP